MKSSISGVSHKERLKQLKADVHVLTLTGHADPAHAADGAGGRARNERDRDAAS